MELGRVVEIVANVGVLAGIVFLVLEINQNSEMIRAEINQGRAEAAMGEAQALYNSEFLPEIFVAIRNGEQLTQVQAERFYHWFRGFNRNQDNQLRQYRQGLLTDDIPRSIRWAVGRWASLPGSIELWESSKELYSDDYITLVDSIIADFPESGDRH